MLKKKIWLINHYATNMFKEQAGRHYWFANYLIREGYEPTIICASTVHNSTENIDTQDNKYIEKTVNDIPFIFVKTPSYSGNGKSRIINMIAFYRNLFPTAKQYAKLYSKPDVILASSVHPLTLVAGIRIAKKIGVPCICEVRDLWPESLVAYGSIKKRSLILKIFYQGEKWIYKKADKLIFTMEGGKDYIIKKGWDKAHGGPVDITKIYNINNGVDLETYDINKKVYTIEDKDLEDKRILKVVYTGSIRRANDIGCLVNTAILLKKLDILDVKILIWGTGDNLDDLITKVKNNNLGNISFKGYVKKKYVPYILSKADILFLEGQDIDLYKYGVSPNKLFEYLAAGKPVLSEIKTEHNIVSSKGCGLVVKGDPEGICEGIINFRNMSEADYKNMCLRVRKTAENFDFEELSKELITIIETEMHS